MGPVYGFTSPGHSDVRFWPLSGFRNYLMLYRPISGGVEVIRIIHGARDLPRQMRRPG